MADKIKNPFFDVSEIDKKEYLSARCSLNRGIMKKLPVYGIDDEIEGKAFSEIFSSKLIAEDIKKVAKSYNLYSFGVSDRKLIKDMNDALVSDNILMRSLSQKIAIKYGKRLGLILLSLKSPNKENIDARTDWNEDCWNYYKNLKTVILTGGLSSAMLGRKFKEQILYVFDYAGIKPYNIMLFENGEYLGIMGCAQSLQKDNTVSLSLDLGHTAIKRGLIKKSNGIISEFVPMESLESRYMENEFLSSADRLSKAIDLHKYLIKSIVSSYKKGKEKYDLSDEILISIASYTYSGILNDTRGGYAKLKEMGTFYDKILSEDLSGELHKRVQVKLVHDGTATALYFSDIDDSVCISLGTSFGVGFPNIQI